MRKEILTFSEFNENKKITEYFLDDGSIVRKITYKMQSVWINPKKGDKQVFIYGNNKWDDTKADLDKPLKDDNGKTVMLKISDLYGDVFKVFPG